jgi:dihydropteroate synthase
MWEVAAEFDVPIVVPFLSGADPKRMALVAGDPLEAIAEFFTARLADADRYGLRGRCILDPGTGFAPPAWPWAQRYEYQKVVYRGLDRLRRFDRPLYIALPWKDTPQHEELLEIVVRQAPEYGRAHHPEHVRDVERRVAAGP